MADFTTTTQHRTRSGACLCGRIHFEITGEPFTFALCHCKNCKRVTGTAFEANLFFKQDNVKIVDAQKLIRTYKDSETRSGRTLHRQFCGNCGSSLFNMLPGKDIMTIASGAVDDTTGWGPEREFYYGDRREWLPEVPRTKSNRSMEGFRPAEGVHD